mmetsp:Transcript_5399/g.20295  ORF Transcript_5399/g.20295 Transcript_5399/m.20295 type:complete len:299 (-) Transcript_5399:269-1165(-)
MESRKNRRNISFNRPFGAALKIASNKCEPLRLSASRFTSPASALASSSPSAVPSSGAHPRKPGMIQFRLAVSPLCAVKSACRKALPHASSDRFHSSGSKEANTKSLNRRSSASKTCLSAGASTASPNPPAALVPPFSFPAKPPALAAGAHSLPDSRERCVRATGDTLGSYALSTAVAAMASEIATSTGVTFSISASPGVRPTLAQTHPKAFSATLLPNKLLHRVWKSVAPVVMPPRYRQRLSSPHCARSFSITREHLASMESAISCPTASSSAFPARTVRSSTSSGVSGSFVISPSIS